MSRKPVHSYTISDCTGLLHQAGGLSTGRDDQARYAGGPDQRETAGLRKVRDIFIPDLHIDTIAVKGRNFR